MTTSALIQSMVRKMAGRGRTKRVREGIEEEEEEEKERMEAKGFIMFVSARV